MAKGIYVGVSDIKLICPRSSCRSTSITRIHTNPDKYQCDACLFEGTLEQFKEGNENTARKVRKSYFGVGGKARKVKKGYIGVGGVARLFYDDGVHKYKKYKAVYHPSVTTYKWDKYDLDGSEYRLVFSAGATMNIRARDIGDVIYTVVRVSSNGNISYSSPKTITTSNYDSLDSSLDHSGETIAHGSFWGDRHLNRLMSSYPENIEGSDDGNIIAKYSGYNVSSRLETGLKGSYAGEVEGSNSGVYPNDGKQDGFWYVYKGKFTEPEYYTQGEFVADVISEYEGQYPDNGRHTDGYWYVKQ